MNFFFYTKIVKSERQKIPNTVDSIEKSQNLLNKSISIQSQNLKLNLKLTNVSQENSYRRYLPLKKF